ncbi:MAG: hypothetical protein LBJ18_00560, partial [Rickettsiales bacterium]|nr:hypothetical protein [Rickettsiales bacterium]
GVNNAENRRVQVVKEIHYTTPGRPQPLAVDVEHYRDGEQAGQYSYGTPTDLTEQNGYLIEEE